MSQGRVFVTVATEEGKKRSLICLDRGSGKPLWEKCVEYLVSDSGSLAFVITADTIASIDLGSRRGDLVRLIEFARGTIMQRHTGVDSLWCAPLRQLYQRLIEPIEAAHLLSHMTRLVLVPHAELNYLPFAALIDSTNHFLIERYELATTPSASVWLALGDRARKPAAKKPAAKGKSQTTRRPSSATRRSSSAKKET